MAESPVDLPQQVAALAQTTRERLERESEREDADRENVWLRTAIELAKIVLANPNASKEIILHQFARSFFVGRDNVRGFEIEEVLDCLLTTRDHIDDPELIQSNEQLLAFPGRVSL